MRAGPLVDAGTRLTASLTLAAALLCFPFACGDKSGTVSESDPPPAPGTISKREAPILHISDLLSAGGFAVTGEFQRFLEEVNGNYLRFDLDSFGMQKSIFQHPLAGGRNTITIPEISVKPGMRLLFSIGVFTRGRDDFRSDGVVFRVGFRESGREHLLFKRRVDTFDRWEEQSVDFRPFAGRTGELELRTEAGKTNAFDWAFWGTPRLIFTGGFAERETLGGETAVRAEVFPAVDEPRGARTRVDYGWFVTARTNDIPLDSAAPGSTFVAEARVLAAPPGGETGVTFSLLEPGGDVLAEKTFEVTRPDETFAFSATVPTGLVPRTLRVTLGRDAPPLLFVKEPAVIRPPGDESPPIILISIDTLRADRLGCYGCDREGISPNIDALARESALFTDVVSASNWTLPAHASMFTSLPAARHLMDYRSWDPVERHWREVELPSPTLAGLLSRRGYFTSALTGGGFVGSAYGFGRGFYTVYENYYSFDEEALVLLRQLTGESAGRPFFLFFHTFEVHDYWKQKPEHRRWVEGDYRIDDPKVADLIKGLELLEEERRFSRLTEKILSERDDAYLRNLYDGAVRHTDDLLGEFFASLKSRGLYDRSWIVLTSDHGEGFGEEHDNGRCTSRGHGSKLYSEELHIPLIIKPPLGAFPALKGTVFDFPSATVDVAPTIIAMAGLEAAPAFSGVNLLDPDARSDERPRHSENVLKGQAAVTYLGLRLCSRPYLQRFYADGLHYDLYDLAEDPGEYNNLLPAAGPNQGAGVLRSLLDTQRALFSGQSPPTAVVDDRDGSSFKPVSDEERRRLEALGYL